MKRLIVDLDNTLCISNGDYFNGKPIQSMIKRLHEYKGLGYDIIIFSSRNMRTYEGNIGKINVNTLPIILDWLIKYQVPHDEVIIGKPWCGDEGFYVDDRAIRPSEFVNKSINELKKLVNDGLLEK